MSPVQQNSPRQGRVDAVDGMFVSGWAADPSQPNQPASLLLVVDGQPLGTFRCSGPRPDVNAHGVAGDLLGFRIELPEGLLDGKTHRLAIRFRTGEVLPYDGQPDEPEGEISYRYAHTVIQGHIDGQAGTFVRGWAYRLNRRTGVKTGEVDLEVWVNGTRQEMLKANQVRTDVADQLGCEPRCGFTYPLPVNLRTGNPFTFELRACDEAYEIDGSPMQGQVLPANSIDYLQNVLAKIEAICTDAYSVKSQLQTLLKRDEFEIRNYHDWACGYYETLRARMNSERKTPLYKALLSGEAQNIKVSVICPTYRPNLADFALAIESVRRQTWTNWELIIVNDHSESAAVTEVIDKFVAEDPRIRCKSLTTNVGISGATAAAFEMATGDWVALFDHDDLLVDQALELMLFNALRTGAKLLYSDEDKIDSYGIYSEPHLKPDWNYRLLLANNYVCHLVLIHRELLIQSGPPLKKYDGAQDHELLLRISESLDEEEIYHVPELLYHWRKTANSTASQIGAKPYAIDAGCRAVADHLKRRGLAATVTAPFQATVFDVRFNFEGEPSVAILIPFKDQIKLTKACVEAILSTTDYENYKIVLIDNWSVEPETRAWTAMIAANPRVDVIRIEERFNYSRINNIAVQRQDCDLLLFMNNDVFVEQPNWLRLMVDEALADPKVGIVGVKLVYPNNMVQHAGVVLGVGGVGDHAFRGLERDAPGYAYRAVLAQDVSAVTAACMLCRTDAFRKVGGFDEQGFAVAFNDVDLCLKIGEAGYRIIYTPAVIASHHESISRGSDFTPANLPRFYEENQTALDRWHDRIKLDRHYNPHWSRERGMFEVLSSASLSLSDAPSLQHEPRLRQRLENAPPLPARPRALKAVPPILPSAQPVRKATRLRRKS